MPCRRLDVKGNVKRNLAYNHDLRLRLGTSPDFPMLLLSGTMSTEKPQKYLFDEVLFFGRNLDEYVKMFNLDLEELGGLEILDCPGGPSPFAGEAEKYGVRVVACDPMHGGSADELEALTLRQIEDVDRVQSQLVHLFDEPQGVAERKALRLVSLGKFIEDFRQFENCRCFRRAAEEPQSTCCSLKRAKREFQRASHQ